MSFWENVDAELNYLGKNRKSLATEVGFSLSNIGKGVRDGSSPSADTAVKVAHALGVTVEYLVTGSDSASEKYAQHKIKSDLALFRKYRRVAESLEKIPLEMRKKLLALIESMGEIDAQKPLEM